MDARQRPPAASYHRHRPRLVLIAACVLIAVGGGWAGLALAARHAAPVARVHVGPARSASSPASSPSAGPAQFPSTNLASLGWSDFGGIELPVSKSAGPRQVRRGLAWGFADTPLGALLAAVNIGVRANAQWGPRIFGPTIRNQVTGLGSRTLLAECRTSYDQATGAVGAPAGQPLGRAYVTEEAFRWVTYTPADATVDVVSAGPGDQGTTVRAVTRIEVQWSGRDWQVIAPPGGDWGNSAASLTSLNGYTRFPAVPA